MGVLGLTPFLQKTCPEVIKHFPDRLRSLAGKKVVIDGTLITQRFHYAQDPHPHRHVLGWYRLVNELNSAGVSAICVFDGKERNVAKAREVERRKDVQRQNAARGALETNRSKRLQKLWGILHQFRELDSMTQQRTTDLLQQLRMQMQKNLTDPRLPERSAFLQLEEAKTRLPQPTKYEDFHRHDGDIFSSNLVPDKALEPMREDDWASPATESISGHLDDNLHHLEAERSSAHDSPHDLPIELDDTQEKYPTPHRTPLLPPSHLPNEPPLSDEDVASTLASLYLGYRESISAFAAIAGPLEPHLSPAPPIADPDAQTELVVTKAQYQLTVEEGDFWDKFVSAAPPNLEHTSIQEEALISLTRTSEMMSDSFQRRMNPPTYEMYNECKEIIRVMGVPCVDTSGAYEAEALASSMVLGGMADFVASEDTDVIVYGAPLIRNLTNRNVPLTTFSSDEIRAVLQLDHASFVDFALLLGTDFSQRIRKIGPARALRFIKEHGTIERIIDVETKYLPRLPLKAYLAEVQLARMVFRTLPPVPDERVLERGVVDEAEVTRVLFRYGLGRAMIDAGDWDYSVALEGNYFDDNPSATF